MTHLLLVVLLSLITHAQAASPQAAAARTAAPLRVELVKFEPVQQGRNVVRVTVKNTGQHSEAFAISVSTSDRRGLVIGWGTLFRGAVGAGETKELRFIYRVYGPVTDNTAIRLVFYNPPSPDTWPTTAAGEPASLVEMRDYSAKDVPVASTVPARLTAASDGERAAVVEVLRRAQQDLKASRYRDVWQSFSNDLRTDYHCETDQEFVINLKNASSGLYSPLWPMDRFLAFQPGAAMKSDDDRVVVRGGASDPDFEVHFTREDGRWKIDDIGGYVSPIDLWATWEQRLLPKMESRRTEHFDMFYAPGSTAAKEADRIAAEREADYRAVAELFGVSPDIRVRLVFFEDRDTKARETGQNADVWAYDQTVVQVFNPVVRPDPFLEVCYLLADTIGNPPPLFKEGVAAYLRERTRAQTSTREEVTLRIDARIREIRERSALIPLDKLARSPVFRPLWSSLSTPGQLDSSIAIPESVSFVKFLVEQFGKEKFLAAYKTLENSPEAAVQEQNIASLHSIYGLSVAELEAQWAAALGLKPS